MNTHFLNMDKKEIEDIFIKCNIDLNTRAEQLNPITLVKLMKELNFNYD